VPHPIVREILRVSSVNGEQFFDKGSPKVLQLDLEIA